MRNFRNVLLFLLAILFAATFYLKDDIIAIFSEENYFLISLVLATYVFAFILLLSIFVKILDGDKKGININEAHPLISAVAIILMLFLFLLLGYISVHLVLLLISSLSKIDAVVIVALITGTVSIVGIFVSKFIEYKNSLREYLSSKREATYGDFVEVIFNLLFLKNNYPQNNLHEDVLKFNKQIVLWGSPKVVEKWGRLLKESRENPYNCQVIIEDLINEMRKDLGSRKINKVKVLSIFIDSESKKSDNK